MVGVPYIPVAPPFAFRFFCPRGGQCNRPWPLLERLRRTSIPEFSGGAVAGTWAPRNLDHEGVLNRAGRSRGTAYAVTLWRRALSSSMVSLPPLTLLQLPHSSCRFESSSGPPLARGRTWSTSRSLNR